jgi:hypothetical protein
MALSAGKVAFKTALKNKLDELKNNQDKEKTDSIDEFLDVLADEIETWITTYAEVSTTVSVTSVSAVQPGAGVSGPGVGSGTGTIL